MCSSDLMYNNCGGPRLASYVNSVSQTIFEDFPAEEVLGLTCKTLNYQETNLAELPSKGLSANYVERETRRAIAGLSTDGQAPIQIWPGIDIDIPTRRDEKKTEPQDVREAVRAALGAGADGVILSRKYSEMRLGNLRAVGEALRA